MLHTGGAGSAGTPWGSVALCARRTLLALDLAREQQCRDGRYHVCADAKVERGHVGLEGVEEEGAHEGAERRPDAHDDERGEAPDFAEGRAAKDGARIARGTARLDAPVHGEQDHAHNDNGKAAGEGEKHARDAKERGHHEHDAAGRALDAHALDQGVRCLAGERHGEDAREADDHVDHVGERHPQKRRLRPAEVHGEVAYDLRPDEELAHHGEHEGEDVAPEGARLEGLGHGPNVCRLRRSVLLLWQGVQAKGLSAHLVGHGLGHGGCDEEHDGHDHREDLHAGGPASALEDRGDHDGEKELRHGGAHEGETPLGAVLGAHVPLAARDRGGDPEHARAHAGEDAVGHEVDGEGPARALGDEGREEEAEEAADGAYRVGGAGAPLVNEAA